MVALASAKDMVHAATCLADTTRSHGMVIIEFNEDIRAETASYLYPVGSTLAVPGDVFGICLWRLKGTESDVEDTNDPRNGFLLIENVKHRDPSSRYLENLLLSTTYLIKWQTAVATHCFMSTGRLQKKLTSTIKNAFLPTC